MEGVIRISKGADGKWVASSDWRPKYLYSRCKPCVVKLMLGLTKKSTQYHTIRVFNEDGSFEDIPTGVNANGASDGRTCQESS